MEQSQKIQAGATATVQAATSEPRLRWYGADLLEVLALSGYGIWILLGLMLGLGIYSEGRGQALVPLALGCGFVSAGLLVACLRLPILPDWHGWQLGRGSRPTRKAMLAFAAFLPMLAVAGLVRGSNDFWATRVAGAALLASSVVSLIYTASEHRRLGLSNSPTTAWWFSHALSACYVGGLWLWLCVAAQDESVNRISSASWVMSLLVLAVLLALVESLRSQTSRNHGESGPYARWLVALLVYGWPSLALLWSYIEGDSVWLATSAALSCGLGKILELRQYDAASAGRS
ncbi:hypothetical protein [Dyella tabacisoli]|uniref:Uncharacterized protein n=1 Tax=Dyella tabacisoli TaxID=2282381 RepID=A0A369UJE4_9GAMM|nr:hypothetical protein [Dyella tabacisoli]RDD80874.1 hypothetical protein DVJ77_14250 [Dyella tabacisoli]